MDVEGTADDGPARTDNVPQSSIPKREDEQIAVPHFPSAEHLKGAASREPAATDPVKSPAETSLRSGANCLYSTAAQECL